MVSAWRVFAALALVSLIGAAGYIFLDINGEHGPRDVGERYGALEDYAGEIVVERVVVGTEEREWVQEVFDNGTVVNRTRPVDGETVDVRTLERPTSNGTRTFRIHTVRWRGVLANATTRADVWYRAPDRYRYSYTSHPDAQLRHALLDGDNATLFYADGRTRDASVSTLGVETLGIRYADVVPDIEDRYRIDLVGEATVDGRPTTVYNVTTIEGDGRAIDRLWLDRDHGFPARVRREASVAGDRVTTTVTYRNMSFDVGLGDEVFAIEPGDTAGQGGDGQTPPTAGEAGSSNVTERSFDALAPAETFAGFTAREPSTLPPSFSLQVATVRVERGNASLRLRYGNGSAGLTVVQAPNGTARSTPLAGATAVAVDGTEGRYAVVEGVGVLRWPCGEYAMEVGGGLARSHLAAIAASVPC